MPEYDHRQKPLCTQSYHIKFAVLKVQGMPGAPKRSGFIVSMGQIYICFVIIVISVMGCFSEKSSPDSEDGGMNGFHCKEDPRCLCFKAKDFGGMFCEDKVLLGRITITNEFLDYNMECYAETEVDPYHYLSIFMFANFSSYKYTVANNAHLTVVKCLAPSSNQSVLFGDGSYGSIGGWRDIPLEKLTIFCESKTLHFSMRRWSALENLKELNIICPNLSTIDENLFSRVSKRLEFLQITNTEIQYLEERFFTDVKTIKTLNLSLNKLRPLRSNFLRSMRSLEELYLGFNEIESIDDDFFLTTENLTILDLEKNSLKRLPMSLCKLKKLKHLFVEYNQITFIPQECFKSLQSLIIFTIKGNKLVTLGLPSVSITPTHYKVLTSDIKFPKSSSIVEESGILNNARISWSSIQQISLDNNSLSSLPDEAFYGMANLEYLNISSNNIAHLPDKIFSRNNNLTVLLASNNLFTNIPSTLLKNKTRLIALDLSYNLVETLDSDFFSDSSSLCSIYINNNRFRHLPNKIFQPFKAQDESCEESFLDMSGNHLEDVPELSIPGLTHLNLSKNRLTLFKPDVFTQTPRLLEVNLSHNLIRIVENPLELDEYKVLFSKYLINLQMIDLSSNRLTVYPSITPVLTTLKHLNLSGNFIKDFSFKPSIQGMHHADGICDSCMLKNTERQNVDIPVGFVACIQGTDLFTGNIFNPERVWSHAFRIIDLLLYLINLQMIDLSSNRLTVYPSITPVLTTLKHLNLSGNFIKDFSFKPNIQGMHFADLALETFDVSRNRLKSVEFFEHWGLDFENTKYVDLSHNLIDLRECREYMHKDRSVWGCLSFLRYLTALEIIKVSHNQIGYIPMEFQHYLPNLRYVDLSHNKIKRLWYGDLLVTRARDTMDLESFMLKYIENYHRLYLNLYPGSKNLTIDLRHNSISSLQLPDDKIEVVIPGCDIDSKFSRVKLLLGHNPFVCDCEVFKLLRYASQEMRPTSALERLNGHRLVVPAVIDIQDLHCSKPDSVKGKAVADVESWGYHWLPMIGFCWNDTGVNSASGHKTTSSAEARVEPPA